MDKKRNYTEYLKTNKLWVKENEKVMSRNSTFPSFSPYSQQKRILLWLIM